MFLITLYEMLKIKLFATDVQISSWVKPITKLEEKEL